MVFDVPSYSSYYLWEYEISLIYLKYTLKVSDSIEAVMSIGKKNY